MLPSSVIVLVHHHVEGCHVSPPTRSPPLLQAKMCCMFPAPRQTQPRVLHILSAMTSNEQGKTRFQRVPANIAVLVQYGTHVSSSCLWKRNILLIICSPVLQFCPKPADSTINFHTQNDPPLVCIESPRHVFASVSWDISTRSLVGFLHAAFNTFVRFARWIEDVSLNLEAFFSNGNLCSPLFVSVVMSS